MDSTPSRAAATARAHYNSFHVLALQYAGSALIFARRVEGETAKLDSRRRRPALALSSQAHAVSLATRKAFDLALQMQSKAQWDQASGCAESAVKAHLAAFMEHDQLYVDTGNLHHLSACQGHIMAYDYSKKAIAEVSSLAQEAV
jgi:hypothetical protein